MSCQSLAAARAFADDKDVTHCGSFHRSVRFSSESRSSTRTPHDVDKKDAGSVSLLTLTVTPVTSQGSSAMSQSAPSGQLMLDDESPPPPPAASCRFPKLEECAHFHYERVALGGLSIETVPCDEEEQCATHNGDSALCEGWICLRVQTHVSAAEEGARALSSSWAEDSGVCEWTLTRNAHNFLQLDEMLHRCIYDRAVSGLPDLSEQLTRSVVEDRSAYTRLISHYVHHLSIIADDSINCAPALNWLQMDNKGHKLLVANEDSSSINTPAVAAAYSVRKYVSQARDEISFEVGDMISIIDMPGPQESLWWRGKRGFRVGFFPHHCVAVIGDKVPRHMTQPPPIVGSVAVAPIKPVLRKHGKLISLFRSFILSRPSRRSLKQQGILRERVFGCDLGEHLLNCGRDVPLVLEACATAIESRGAVDGIYRLSGGAGLTQRLRAAFDAGRAPDLDAAPVARDPHATASLLKMYFRELPNPLCTYQLYDSFVNAVQSGPDESIRLGKMRETVIKLPPPHYRTLSYLMRHLRRVSLRGAQTGMTARNMAIVWAPNLLRSPRAQHALQGVAVQAVVTEFLICYAEELFSCEQGAAGVCAAQGSSDAEPDDAPVVREEACEMRRPKSLALPAPAKLLSLEEAQRRGKSCIAPLQPAAPTPPPTPPTPSALLRPSTSLRPKYIEVGSGPNNLPQYHTVLELPVSGGKRGLKRSPSGWRGIFSRSKQVRHRSRPQVEEPLTTPAVVTAELPPPTSVGLRPVKSCESLQSEGDALPPLAIRAPAPLKHHTRSASCDSYFEPWQAELADMRLRLSPQERDHNIFSEEDDTVNVFFGPMQGESMGSSPVASELCSVEPSPLRILTADVHARQDHAEGAARPRRSLEEQLAQIGYIDAAESPRARLSAEKRHSPANAAATPDDLAKRLCKDRDSPVSSLSDFQNSILNVKLRERNSPRKVKNTSRYSGMHHPVTNLQELEKTVTVNQGSRLSWHGKDGHSTLIKIDWPAENASISNLTNSTINSSPITPVTPIYDPLESDSELSEVTSKSTVHIKRNCSNCHKEKCLKCELKATDYEGAKADFKIGMPVSNSGLIENVNLHDSLEPSPIHSEISYQNLNRLSAVSTSSNEGVLRNSDVIKSVMTSSHESSSSYSNASKHDELYEPYNFERPNYINLQSSSTSKSSPTSPLKSPLKSTISITFRSPTKTKGDYELISGIETPTNERDSVYEDVDLDKNLSIVEDASIPETDASLPTQQACQPDSYEEDLIILETPTDNTKFDDPDLYSQVKFFKKSIEEVNAMILESPEKEQEQDRHYENIPFPPPRQSSPNHYENINVDSLKICDKNEQPNEILTEYHIKDSDSDVVVIEKDNGNIIKKVQTNLNVRELAHRFESPTEQKGPFTFEKFKAEIKYPTLERKDEKDDQKAESLDKRSGTLSKSSSNARSLDENAFIQEFGPEADRRKSLEVREAKTRENLLPDLNLNLEDSATKIESVTPTTENKISLVQRFEKPDLKSLIGFETEKKLSRERIEKYKEERRIFLREKYSSQSFRNNPEHLTRIKIKKDIDIDEKADERLHDSLPKFERRNTVDLGQRMRFSLAKSANNLDSIHSPVDDSDVECKGEGSGRSRDDRKERISPSFTIRDMAARFEQKSQNNTTG